MDAARHGSPEAGELLPEEVPVTMPELPLTLSITTAQQFKAIGDPVRSRILGIIQHEPATAKQIADRLGIAPGTIGHHLRVLEDAGLAWVVARRLVRGIVAKYYTRTARIFSFELPPELTGGVYSSVDILTHARDELAETFASLGAAADGTAAFPHVRLSPERACQYKERLNALVDELVREPSDPEGQVYGVAVAMFLAPAYIQRAETPPPEASASDTRPAGDTHEPLDR